MIQIRSGVFETNSSSTHSIAFCTKEAFLKWKNEGAFLDYNGNIYTRDEIIKLLLNRYPNEDFSEISDGELRYYGYKSYDYCCNSDLDLDWNEWTTPSGEEIVAICQYGYDG